VDLGGLNMPYATKSDPDGLARYYREAADLIRKRGWCRRYLKNPKGQVCLSGALLNADGADQHYRTAQAAIWKRVGYWPPIWNDEVAKNGREVIDLLESMAEAECP
jgi:hypothetical protein